MLLMSFCLEFRDSKVVVLVLVGSISSLSRGAALGSLTDTELFCLRGVEGILPVPFHISLFIVLGLCALLVPWSCLLWVSLV